MEDITRNIPLVNIIQNTKKIKKKIVGNLDQRWWSGMRFVVNLLLVKNTGYNVAK